MAPSGARAACGDHDPAEEATQWKHDANSEVNEATTATLNAELPEKRDRHHGRTRTGWMLKSFSYSSDEEHQRVSPKFCRPSILHPTWQTANRLLRSLSRSIASPTLHGRFFFKLFVRGGCRVRCVQLSLRIEHFELRALPSAPKEKALPQRGRALQVNLDLEELGSRGTGI